MGYEVMNQQRLVKGATNNGVMSVKGVLNQAHREGTGSATGSERGNGKREGDRSALTGYGTLNVAKPVELSN